MLSAPNTVKQGDLTRRLGKDYFRISRKGRPLWEMTSEMKLE